jgi:hypothetical protein
MRERGDELLGPFVWLVALHSYAVGLGLLLAPGLAVTIGGFPEPETLFFMHQGGVFHLVVATGYLIEYRRSGTATLLVFAKTVATVFLGLSWLLPPEAPWLIGVSALGDGAMGAVAWWLSRRRTSPVP